MNKDITKVKNILKKYDIQFINEKELKRWFRKLSDIEYENLLKLDVNKNEIDFDPILLINKNLLACSDYQTRVFAMSKIKCPKEYNYLVNVLVSKDFLNSKNYYLDLVFLSKAKHIKYCLWLLLAKNYENNKHHIDDISLISKAENPLTAQVLSEVAMNQNSLQSRYHRRDMEMIASCSSEYLQPTSLYPAYSINNLAVNKVSLCDPFHLDNMQILSSQKVGREYLYLLMTDEVIINGKNYRREISRLQKSKTTSKARAIYYYIVNPQRTCTFDYFDGMFDIKENIDYTTFDRGECVKGEINSRYNFYLKLLNEIDDDYVMYVSYLLSNKNLNNSIFLDEDIKFILKITNKKIFLDLFIVMQNKNSLNSYYHKNDIDIISRTENNLTRKMLVNIATNKDSLNSIYHQYDMLFIASLNLDDLDESNLNELTYYLLDKRGLTSKEHINSLEKIYNKINDKKSEDKIIKKIRKI